MENAEPQHVSPGSRIASALGIAAGLAVRVARSIGASFAAGYAAIDPDVRRHVAQLPLLGLTMLAPRPRALAPLPDDGRPPLLLVHGLGGHPGNFLPLRSYLRLRGRRRAYAVTLAAGVPLDALAETFAAELAEIARLNELPPDGQVQVVAHSLGGLVVRLALDSPEVARRIETLVTLGTPHAGTHLARLADTEATRSLRRDSKVVASLRRQLPWRGPPDLPRLVAFWSGADVLLLPHDTAQVEGAENVELAGLTHAGYLLHPRAWQAVWDALAPAS